MRVSYVGELGWELHVPMTQLESVYDVLWQAGKNFDLVNVGHYAINSLRMEKGYCSWGSDISPDETPRSAGLNFAVDYDKPFLGRDSLASKRTASTSKCRIILVLEDPEPVLWGGEPIWQANHKVGYTTSGAYGHSLGAAVGMGYVPIDSNSPKDTILTANYEIEINGHRHAAKAFTRPPYDPTGLRLKC